MNTKKRLCVCLIIFTILAGLSVGLFGCKHPQKTNTQYKIAIDFDEDTHTYSASQEISFCNVSDYAMSEILLNFYPNAYAKKNDLPVTEADIATAYPYGVNFSKTSDLALTCDSVSNYTFISEDNLLKINLNKPLETGDFATIILNYKVTLPATAMRFGFNESAINLTNFYFQLCPFISGEWIFGDFAPFGDPLFSQTADYFVEFNLPTDYEYVCSGTSSVNLQNNIKVVTAKAENIRDFGIVLSSVCGKLTADIDGLHVEYLYNRDTNPTASTNKIAEIIQFYSATFCAYPHESISVAEVPFSEGGMEYGALAIISDKLNEEERTMVIAHELAHQWWYGIVGNNSFEEAWLDEGLSEYSVYQYYISQNMPTAARRFASSAENSYNSFVAIQAKIGEPCVGQLSLSLGAFHSVMHYVCITYSKGFMLFNFADKIVSHDVMLKILSQYLTDNRFKIATADSLWACFDKYHVGSSQVLRSWAKNS